MSVLTVAESVADVDETCVVRSMESLYSVCILSMFLRAAGGAGM